jgi:hypothetical protein
MKTLLTILFLLLPVSAWATDGDHINGAEVTRGSYSSSAFVFCDTKIEASDNVCAEFDLQASGRGMPDYIIVSLETATSCTAGYQITVNGATTTGGTAHAWGILNAAYTSLVITTPVHRFLSGVTVDAGCATTGLHANIVLYYER